MKRSRNSKLSNSQKGKGKSKQSVGGGDDDGEVPIWSGFGSDLPRAIFIDILLRLPIKSILICRFVCKTWSAIILDPEFVKLQYQNSQLHLMFRTNDSKHISRTLFLVDVESFNLNLRCCNGELSNLLFDNYVHINIDTKFNIPLRDAKMVLDNMLAKANNVKVNSRKKWFITARPTFDKFGLVNSCNGLLCLSEPIMPISNNPVIITGEFIKLPEAPKIEKSSLLRVHSGFGFSRNTNQYKVVRMYSRWVIDPHTGKEFYHGEITEVYTLGKGSWKAIGGPPCSLSMMEFPTYLNGAFHWFCSKDDGFYSVVSFDFETELFKLLPLPHYYEFRQFPFGALADMSMGVLRGYLCICDNSDFQHVGIWVMKDYGVQESWIKMFHIEFDSQHRWLPGPYQVIKCYENGAVLIFHPSNYLVYYCPNTPGFFKFRYFKIRGSKPKFETFTHVPSLISLKDVLAENGIEVLNVNSRCGQFKLREEDLAFCFVEEVDMEMVPDSEASSSPYESDDESD